jgi:hypothetical protein
MIQVKRKAHDEPKDVEVQGSTISYARLAASVGHQYDTDSHQFTVSIDGGRKNPVLADDEMTVVDGQLVEINW